MKKGINTILALSTLLFVACSEGETPEEVVVDEVVTEATTYTTDVEASEINWRGEVAGIYGHDGYVNLQSGMVEMADNKLVGGEFTVDMTTFYPTDSASYKDVDGGRIADLQNHLSSEDFFASATYPTSTFVITSVEGNKATGDLTVRGKTNQETFNITSIDVTESGLNIKGKLVFDRQKYDVAWVHYMKDMILSDNIALTINLVATK